MVSSFFGAWPLILIAGSIIGTWAMLFSRVIPSLCCDRGIFVSVAERLLAGDRLYAQVFDNKEPFFYYFVAAQRALGPSAEPAAELLLLVIAGVSAYFLASRLSDKRTAAVVGFIMTPLILTGRYYWPGYTHLPGATLCLAAFALTIGRRPALAGAAIALLLFTKLIMVPLALAVSILLIVLERSYRDFWRFAAGFTLMTGLSVAILLARAEFGPFVKALQENVDYANGSLIESRSILESMLAHLRRVADPYAALLVLSEAVAVGLILLFRARFRKAVSQMSIATTACLILSLGVLATTGMWRHHNQILYLSAVLAAVCLAPLLAAQLQRQTALGLGLALCGAVLLGGATDMRFFAQNPAKAPPRIASLSALSPETRRLLTVKQSGAYARLGVNDDRGHAFGLRRWDLLCARFHQYRFQRAEMLRGVLACATTSPTIIVAKSFVKKEGWSEWNRFVEDVEKRLLASYTCDADSGLRICTLRAAE